MSESWDGKQCPVCGAGTLHDGIREERSDYRGQEFHARQRGAYCDACDDGIIYADKSVEDQWKAFKANVDRAEREELLAIRQRLGLTQRQAASLTGGGHNAFSRYERGEAQPVLAVLNLFRLLDKHPFLLTTFGLPVPKLEIPKLADPDESFCIMDSPTYYISNAFGRVTHIRGVTAALINDYDQSCTQLDLDLLLTGGTAAPNSVWGAKRSCRYGTVIPHHGATTATVEVQFNRCVDDAQSGNPFFENAHATT